jgi:hypothetical protein
MDIIKDMNALKLEITDIVQDYINEYYDIDDVIVITRSGEEMQIEVLPEDTEVDEDALVCSLPDLVCFDAEGNQVPDGEEIESLIADLT